MSNVKSILKKRGKVSSKKKPTKETYSQVIFTRYTGNGNYKTPKDVYENLNKEFHFTFDPCPINSKPSKNGLTERWGKRVFVNPPYSDPNVWVEKGLTELKKGHSSVVVYLLKGDISTALFHDIVFPYAQEIRALRGRLKFEGLKDKKGKVVTGNSPFPSVVAIFRGPKVRKWELPVIIDRKGMIVNKVRAVKKVIRKKKKIAIHTKSKKPDSPKIPESEPVQEQEGHILP